MRRRRAGRVLIGVSWLSLACAQESMPAMPERSDAALDVAGDAARNDASDDGDAGTQLDDGSVEAGMTGALEPDGDGVLGERVQLVRHDLWTRLAPAEDGFADAPPVVDCGPGATAPELLGVESVFSVETGLCNYLTVTQPTLSGVAAGETIKVRLWHFDLRAAAPAEAHTALTVDGAVILDERIGIPQQGGLLVREIRVERAIAEGAPVRFHLHNHGANSWSLVEVSKGPG